MTEFTNVTVIKQANIYFDGKVTSRKVIFADGTYKTLGIMLPGEYEFSTAAKEVMEIVAGDVTVQLPGEKEWQSVSTGGIFTVPANAKFAIKVNTITDYCCSYY